MASRGIEALPDFPSVRERETLTAASDQAVAAAVQAARNLPDFLVRLRQNDPDDPETGS